MAIVRYEPFRLLEQLQRELERSFGTEGNEEGAVATAQWRPAVDIKEENDRFCIHADLPGVKPEDLEVTMEQGVLTIKGERKSETKSEKEGYKRVERVWGSFYRRFTMPDTADADKISAKMKDGELEIVIPKKPAVLPKKITVGVS